MNDRLRSTPLAVAPARLASANVADVLVHQRDEERETALRALLMHPLLPASEPACALVRRHADYLRDFFDRECAWPLAVQREAARLYKRPADLADATRGAPEFGRARYLLLCLVCMVLERSDPQITLRTLAERLLEAAADPELAALGHAWSLEPLHERRDLVAACRFLLEHGVLSRVAGDEEAWIGRTQEADVLYDVNRRLLALLPASPRGASLIEATAHAASIEDAGSRLDARLAALGEEFVAEGESGVRGAARHRVARRLLDDPVLYHSECSGAEREYLATQRGALAARLAAACGLVAELRAEGMALVDADGELSDERLPAQGTEAHVTLLVAERLARAQLPSPCPLPRAAEGSDDGAPVFAPRQIAAWIAEAAVSYGRYWRKAAREPGAESALAEQAIERLARLGLVERVAGGVRARPALLRYSLGDAQVAERGAATHAAQGALFESR